MPNHRNTIEQPRSGLAKAGGILLSAARRKPAGRKRWGAAGGLGWMALSVFVVATQSLAQEIDFSRDVQPIFAKNCIACHGPSTHEGGLQLTDRDSALASLESGAVAIVPGQPAQSELIRRISADEGERMPPEGQPLSAEQIKTLSRWIEEGAVWKEHWGFAKPVRHEAPSPSRLAHWVRSEIDAFVLSKLLDQNLTPAPACEDAALIRRAYYDVTGLPPTPEQVQSYLSDPDPEKYTHLIDRLLESQQFGEHWARHWLDLVRFAETNSYERDGPKPEAWRYRDYVIRSFNADLPYDRFIVEQLAGDELPNPTPDQIIATGYYRLGIWDDEPADPAQARYDGLDDIVSTTGQTFLGLTINCARCHDHKIDPMTQSDYYGMLAFFHNIAPYSKSTDHILRPIFATAEDEQRYVQQSKELDQKRNDVQGKINTIEEQFLAAYKSSPENSNDVTVDASRLIRRHGREILGPDRFREYQQLRRDRAELGRRSVPVEQALCVTELGSTPPETFILTRGSPQAPAGKVEPHVPAILGGDRLECPPSAHSSTSGRRLVLARWIASRDNVQTARVMVNRIWQHLFERGIVRSTSNFGIMGTAPTHPELLDWLAIRFMDDGWSIKSMIRLIMLSNTYRMSSIANEKALAVDPDNDLFWRQNMRRLSAEELRDSILAANGTLNRAVYGPSVFPVIPKEVLAGQSQPGSGWGKSSSEEQARRSVYVYVKRSLRVPLLESFDSAETDITCPERFVTTQPTQALGLLNGDFINDQAAKLAERIGREQGGDQRKQVERCLWLVTQRQPAEAEIEQGLKLIRDLIEQDGAEADFALRAFCLMAMNMNEFIYLD
jgi:mono/diheme cytochrome c family protein